MDLVQETFPNGVTVVAKANHFVPTVAIQAWVGVGSLHEGPNERGMAHYIEHMLFKGTKKRAVGEIAETVEAAGGEINAYTTFDHTVFHLTLAGPHAAVGLDLLYDAFANSTFDPAEFDREKEVILEEIKRSADSPGAKVGRRVFELAFAGTEAGRPIIGSEASVGGFKRDELYAFYKRWYQPDNVTVVIVGDMDPHEMVGRVRDSFGSLPRGPVTPKQKFQVPPRAVPAEGTPPVVSILKGDFQQPRLEIVFPAPSMEDLDSTGLDLAAFALGTGEMGRLSRRLRDAEGIVNSVGASVYSPLFGGVFEMSALTTEDRLLDAISGLAREVVILREREPVTGEELSRARANLKADRIYRDETVDGQARTLGFGMMTPQGVTYDDVYATQVNTLPDTTVAGALTRWLAPERATIVLLVNETSKLTEKDVQAAYQQGVAAGRKTANGTAKLRKSRGETTRPAAEVMDLMPGIRFIYRQNPNVGLFTVTLATEGGLRAETKETAGIHNALSAMLGTASQGVSFEALMSAVEGMGANLQGFSGKDSVGFHVQCLVEDTAPTLELLRGCLMEPVFPEEQWTSLRREIEQSLTAQNDSPAGICVRRFQEMLFGDHPYRYPLVGTEESVAKFTPEDLLNRYGQMRDSGPWTVSVAGPGSVDEAAEMIKGALEGFKPKAAKRHFASEALVDAAGWNGGSKRVTKDREQSHIVYGFRGLAWDDKDRPALDVLVNVLGGHGGRLFKELRDKDSLAYTVSPMLSYGVHPGIVGSYIACAPSKAERALASLKHEMLKLLDAPPSDAELERARSYIIGTHDMGLQKSDAQTSTMALMELYGYGYDDFLLYPKRIEKVTTAQVLAVARRLFDPAKAAEVIVGPA